MKKIKLLYDATAICSIFEKNVCRGGIFFAAYNLLLEFLKRKEFDVYLYADSPCNLINMIESFSEFKNCKIYEFSLLDNISVCFWNLKQKNEDKKCNDILSAIILFFSYFIEKLNKFYLNYFADLREIDIYFSIANIVPDFIQKRGYIKKYLMPYGIIPALNQVNKYLLNSDYTKQEFIKKFPDISPDNILVVPLAPGRGYFRIKDYYYINQIKRKYGIPTDKKYVFNLCNLEPHKNLIFSIRNFLRFVTKNNLEDFIFVVGGCSLEDYEKFIRENYEMPETEKSKIFCAGYIDDEDMSALYSGAEMFLYPSFYESFGMAVLEAMKCGLPVICSNTSSLSEIVGECGIKINPASDNELISALEKMYYQIDFKEQCIKKGVERAKLFSWKRAADIITNDMYKDLQINI